MVIMAIGQKANLKFITEADGIKLTPRGLIETDPDTQATSREGVFAGGDVVTGPWIAIGAVAAGREAAISIDRYLARPGPQGRPGGAVRPHPRNGNWNPIPRSSPEEARALMPAAAPVEEWTQGLQGNQPGLSTRTRPWKRRPAASTAGCAPSACSAQACQAGAVTHACRPGTNWS